MYQAELISTINNHSRDKRPSKTIKKNPDLYSGT